ncbi:MAG TPA: argininosuccinate synthase [Dehalococcoidales bacterium]|nr:argininosuccinate synthase [Dehalococcoidales bacterium]
METVVLAYSGGVDTSVAIKWVPEHYNMEVITLTVDIGNVRDLDGIKKKAEKLGVKKAYVIDAKKTFVEDYCWPALQANAIYESCYPLATALGRPLIAKLLVEVALENGARAVSHGCTGKGNDQVRLDMGINTLAPDLRIIAPAREWGMTREETIAYAHKNKIPIPVTKKSPYSIDENLWGRAVECGILEEPMNEPPADAFAWTRDPDKTPDKPAYVEIEFEQGIPVALDGLKMDGISLIDKLNQIAGENGVGRIDHIENRLVGIKSREVYEAPAAVVLIQAHMALEQMCLTKQQQRFKEKVAVEYSDLIYNGGWFSAMHQDLAAYVKSTQRFVTGVVRMKLFKGTSMVAGRKSPYSLYSFKLATYDKGDTFDQSHAVGFIQLWGLQTRIQAQIQPIGEESVLKSIKTEKKTRKVKK